MKQKRKTNNKALSDQRDKGAKQCKALESDLRAATLKGRKNISTSL